MTDIHFLSWKDVPSSLWVWDSFTPKELACRADGALLIVPEFMDRLQALRKIMDRPLVVSSGYRTPEYNAKISNTGKTGPHTTGRAADIVIRGGDALALIAVAHELGFTGIGVNQKGVHADRFIHLDDLPQSIDRTRPWVWTY